MPRAAPGPSVSEVRKRFAAVAACIEAGGSPAAVTSTLRAAWSQCDREAGQQPDGDAKRQLISVQQALETWQRVWPRMGSQREFGAAVIREARLWAKHLS